MDTTRLGVCYYPEHWPPEQWPAQARRMRALGLELVRIAEFAWSRIEPARDQFQWAWLDAAIEALAAESLGVVMCTPTACPPKWLVDELPVILPADEHGNPRRFGSRRHYRFASPEYHREAERICRALFERYAQHPAVVGWQFDNEYGCHDTTLSYAAADRDEFCAWLRECYGDIDALNEAWGTVFWSQEYTDFDAIELPVATVTEANPAHRLAYRRFASEQVVRFNRLQAELLREEDGGRSWVTHNFMGLFTDFDHFEVGKDLDVATWDSYPLGFLDVGAFSPEEKAMYRQIGHPDLAAFNHDLYRAVGRGRWGVMEQQPGPVNWARSNAQPLAGAVRFWAWEAIAHGAELVSFFRYQQLPVAQEQMHAALHLPDGSPAPAAAEVAQLAAELEQLPVAATRAARVALVFDYPSCWGTAIQPHNPRCGSLDFAFEYYRALRQLGLDIDIISPGSSLESYGLVVIPSVLTIDDGFARQLAESDATVVVGPRSGSRTHDFAIPGNLAPGPLRDVIPLRVIAVDAMRPGATSSFEWRGLHHDLSRWYEEVETDLAPVLSTEDGRPLWYRDGRCHYLNAWLPSAFLVELFDELARDSGIVTERLPMGVRSRRRGDLTFYFNFWPGAQRILVPGAERVLGEEEVAQGDLSVWRTVADE